MSILVLCFLARTLPPLLLPPPPPPERPAEVVARSDTGPTGVDLERLLQDRMRMTSFNDAVAEWLVTDDGGNEPWVFLIDDNACTRCNLCVERCPTDTLYYARLPEAGLSEAVYEALIAVACWGYQQRADEEPEIWEPVA